VSGQLVAPGGRWRAFIDRFMPVDATLDPERERRARFTLGLAFAGVPIGIFYTLRMQWMLEDPIRTPVSLAMLGLAAVCWIPILLIRRGLPIWIGLHVVLGYTLLLCSVLALFLGGMHGPLPFWLVILPAVSILGGSIRTGLAMLGASQLVYAGFAWLITHDQGFVHMPPRWLLVHLWFGTMCGMFATTFGVMLAFDRTKEEALLVLGLTHRALLRARDHARAASQWKSAFLARVGQDLRTPMALVIESADALAGRVGSADVGASQLDTIGRNARRLMQTIDRIVDLSQMESDRLAIEQVDCDPRALVADVVAVLRDAALRQGIELRTECADDVPVQITTDPARLRQILANFARNALLFSEASEVWVAVRRADRGRDEPCVEFEVRDSGIGIPADTLARIFEPFQQADASAARRFEGTGLGLWIARRLCERMGGEISAESAPGAGSAFRARLPVHGAAPLRPTPARSAADAPHAPEAARAPVGIWDRVAQHMVPEWRRGDPRALHEARMVLALAVVPTPVVIPWAIATARLFGPEVGPLAGFLLAGTVPVLWLLTWLYRLTGSTQLAGNVLAAYSFVMLTVNAYLGGGALSPTHYWLLLIPVSAPVIGVRAALAWSVLGVLECTVFFALERMGASPRNWLPVEVAAMTAASGASTLGAVATGMIALFRRAHIAAVEHSARANEDLVAARKEAEEASRRKSDFLANMSHELRTPMTAILGYADLLAEEWSAQPELRRSASVIQRSTRELVAVVDELIDLNRLHDGHVDLERVAFGPEELARNAAELLRERAAAKALDLSVRVRPPVPARVQGDPTRVRQILVNLIGNAIKFTSTGSVDVRVKAGSGWIRYEVEDTGPGLSEEQTQVLLRHFSDEGDASDSLDEKPGIGLTVTRLLCRLMGGELGFTSRPGVGSCFYVQIPAALAPAPETRAPSSAPASAAPPVRLRSRVLLVEDSPDVQTLISHLLRKAGANVTVAANGQEGLDQVDASNVRDEPFGLVLMDLQMPVLDGYATVRELRRRGSTLPIVALTAHALEEERLHCLEAGFDAFATKPIDRRTLLALVQEWSADEKTV
jgi:signal transduction histidine kinase/ActR/RegA family two-component response regulator